MTGMEGTMLEAGYLFILSTDMPLRTWVHLLLAYLLWYLCYGISVHICQHVKDLSQGVNRACYICGCAFWSLSAAGIVALLLPIAAYIRILTMLQSTCAVQKVHWTGVSKADAVQRRKFSRQRWKDSASYMKAMRHKASRG